jgi:hypothetical protein
VEHDLGEYDDEKMIRVLSNISLSLTIPLP